MLNDAQTDEISEKISSLFQGMDLDDVAHILKIQMAMLVQAAPMAIAGICT